LNKEKTDIKPSIVYELFKTIRTCIKAITIIVLTILFIPVFNNLIDHKLVSVGTDIKAFIEFSDNTYVWIFLVAMCLLIIVLLIRMIRYYIKKFAPYKDDEQREIWTNKISSKINKDGSTLNEDKK